MVTASVSFPGPGCIVEFMQGNKPVQAWVLEASSGSVRLLSEGRRESKLSASRLLPWLGPVYSGAYSKQDMADILERHRLRREELAASVVIEDIWELAQGEVETASPAWLAELLWADPDVDRIAAMGHAALACKTRFRFNPPDFVIYDADKVALRETEQAAREKREALASAGSEFFRTLWAIYEGKREKLTEDELPPEELAAPLAQLLRERIADPEAHDTDDSWKLLTSSLPDIPLLPLRLAEAWGLVPRHHNYLMDQADYATDPAWAAPFADDIRAMETTLAEARTNICPPGAPLCYSIDAADTKDVDDAFFVSRDEAGIFSVQLLFACPSLAWPFGSALDKAVQRRATSLYLPEATYHMIPETAGLALFGLSAEEERPVLRITASLDATGVPLSVTPELTRARLADRLTFAGVQAVLDPQKLWQDACPAQPDETERAAQATPFLRDALALAKLLQQKRLENGAVVTDRTDPVFTLKKDEAGEIQVTVTPGPACPDANLMVSELMIFANHVLAQWARERDIPLFHRTQDVALPREFAGIWTAPQDISRVVRYLPPAALDTAPRPHAGLGVKFYATITSPLRRYVDLVNQSQIVHYLQADTPRLDRAALETMLPPLSARLDLAARVQRFRPRYWKLLFVLQQGDDAWWEATVSDEGDNYATLSLPLPQLFVRVKRRMLGEKVYGGQKFRVRLGKIAALLGEFQVLEAVEDEQP